MSLYYAWVAGGHPRRIPDDTRFPSRLDPLEGREEIVDHLGLRGSAMEGDFQADARALGTDQRAVGDAHGHGGVARAEAVFQGLALSRLAQQELEKPARHGPRARALLFRNVQDVIRVVVSRDSAWIDA